VHRDTVRVRVSSCTQFVYTHSEYKTRVNINIDSSFSNTVVNLVHCLKKDLPIKPPPIAFHNGFMFSNIDFPSTS
jgi:ubiquitin-protein ligase